MSENNFLKDETDYLKQMLGKVSVLLHKMPPSDSIRQIRKLVHCADCDTWNSDLWSDSEENELTETFNSTSQPVSLYPVIKTEIAVNGEGGSHYDVNNSLVSSRVNENARKIFMAARGI